jgi:hypothetical protein
MGATQDSMDAREMAATAMTTSVATGTLSYAHPMSDRRTAPRQKQMFVTQMTPWAPGHPSIPFEVILEDTSDTGAGVIAERPCKIGLRHLLMVPRETGEKPVMREYKVVRCDLRTDGKYGIGLEQVAGMTLTNSATEDAPDVQTPRTSNGSQLKLVLLALALVCLLIALFMPL